ncbi:MAG: FMN reductase (NAD(P)H) [bacterium ADurb.Bin478]|nr:MAG: FMN reductase (NAD(P)H) [bacterium ADurb.Bin478]
MDVFEAINRRTSVRSFTDKPVDEELVRRLIDAGRRAPSGRNVQPIEFIVITDPDRRRYLATITEYGKFLAQAPVCIVVVSADTKYYLEDGCAAAENILLAAAGLGLGSCWVAGDKKPYAEEIIRWLQAPDGFKLVAMLAIGYAASPTIPREKKAVDKILHWQTY